MKNSIRLSNVSALFLCSSLLVFFSCKKENQPAAQAPGIQSALQLVPVGTLSVTRDLAAVATAGNKIFFAGGSLPDGSVVSRVDIYDISSRAWSIAELSEARAGVGAITVGNKVLFAGGGVHFDSGLWAWDSLSSRVDIYDVVLNSWTTTEMPEPGLFNYGHGVTGTAGNRAFFYSGYWTIDPYTPTAFIYDVTTNSWSSERLSENSYKDGPAAASFGYKLAIAGGLLIYPSPLMSKVVDIYDNATNTWHTDSLSTGRSYLKTAVLGNKAFFAGGKLDAGGFSNKVDIYDNASQSWTVDTLSRATILAGASSASQKVLFFGDGDNLVDIYDASSNSWSTAQIPESFFDGAAAIFSAGGNIYATKGGGGTVWRVQL